MEGELVAPKCEPAVVMAEGVDALFHDPVTGAAFEPSLEESLDSSAICEYAVIVILAAQHRACLAMLGHAYAKADTRTFLSQ